ncbi:PolC-type DNA polymerase III [Tannockella kyphosi]|uniref:PolC-type DNA polymerase III n=1 Tax=Tannockella kyphosi TaxID=2899121 RepID=UPI0020137933|nr:PolC-type DNA polymerase III [Tannockella kyphosi]
MNNKIDILLKQLEIEQQVTALKDASLQRVIVGSKDFFHFTIYSTNLLPYCDFALLLSNAYKFEFPCTFEFVNDGNEYYEEEINSYLTYVLKKLETDYPTLPSLTFCPIEIKDKIIIKAVNKSHYQEICKTKQYIESQFQIIGINKKVSFEIDDKNDDYIQSTQEMESVKLATVDISDLIPKNETPKTYSGSSGNNYYQAGKSVEMLLSEITSSTMEKNVLVRGYIFKTDLIKTKAGSHIQTLWITDYTDSIIVKRFENKRSCSVEEMKVLEKAKGWVEVRGEIRFDTFAGENTIMARKIESMPSPKERNDNEKEKRVELHTHSKMSAMDGINEIGDYVKTVAKWGHKAIAICDHGNCQSFPDAQQACAKNDVKMIYGVELNFVNPEMNIVYNSKDCSLLDATYVSFDLETTGLSVFHDGVTEFGAVKICHGEVVDRLQSFINPQKQISTKISNLTSITNEMVKNAPTIEEFMPKILEFFDDCILVAHNAKFDIGFLNENLSRMGQPEITNPVIDTLPLARMILKPMKSYRLGNVCRQYKVPYDDEVAHRADYDAQVLGDVLTMMIYQLIDENKFNLLDVTAISSEEAYKYVFPNHMTILAKNKIGLKNLFKIVTEANTVYYHREALIIKERLDFYREGLLYGSSCYQGDVFDIALYGNDKSLKEAIAYYDYIEIQPLEDYYHLVERGKVDSMEAIKLSILRIIKEAKNQNKIIVASGDVHFLNPKDKIYRDVFISNPTIGISRKAHPLCDRKNPKAFTPNQYLRTTTEMLDAFHYLDKEEAFEYVVTNTNLIADMIEELKPVHDKLFTPFIEGADENLRSICYDNAHALYGKELPDIVEKRLERELGNIIKHGFGVIYYISHKLVKKSNDDGYLVGSRGSVGSSFVATMSGITEVNPLPPHYVCLSCGYNEFMEEGVVANGYDLENKDCPVCGKPLKGEGHNIPFETFLGFEADKVPDIDLNFSGAYQSKAHDYTKVLFGEDKVFRAGTISTVAEKTAYGYAKGYSELTGREDSIRGAELERIAKGCQGVKRTTGQHPGGIIVIPNDMDVYDFTPVQFPADDLNSPWKTTHFDFHAIHDNVLKLDILGHVDPTVIRALQDLTGVDPKTIPTNDKKVMSLFTSTKEMGVDLSFINCKNGALGLPEFGTSFVRQMLDQTQPKDFNDLVIISGLSHGTDVYLGNAEMLIKNKTCTLSEVIGCRDDIMVYLIEKGLPNKAAFDIMEVVRKGRSSEVFPVKKYEELMKEHNVPQWYIDSCKKIKYMFPKAHAAAYVLSAVRVAWWKLYYPREYYSVYFSTRCDAFDLEAMCSGKEAVLERREQIVVARENRDATNKDESLWDVLEIVLEMFERGYHLNPISLDKSAADSFTLDPDDKFGILPPFSALDSLGTNVANTVIEARKNGAFLSIEDVTKRTKLNNSHIKLLTSMGVFKDMQETNQLSLF